MRTLSLASMLILCSGAAAQDLTIADLAPEESFIIVGADDASSAIASFKNSGTWALLQDPEISAWFEETMTEAMSDLEGALDAIDADLDDFSEPTGLVGFAAWLNAPADDAEGNDALPLHFLMGAGFGVEADDMHDMIVRALEEGENEDRLTYESDRMGDAMIFTVQMNQEAMEEDEWDDDFDDEWGDDDWGDAGGSGPSEFYYAKHGEHLLMSSSMDDLENALSRMDGVDIDNAAGTASFSRLKPAGSHDAYALILNGPLYDMTDMMGENGQLEMMGLPPVMPMLDALGLAEVRGVSVTLDFDEDKGDTVGEFFVSVPRMRGLMNLVNVPDKPFTAPAFVSPDAATVSMLQVDIAGLLPAIQQAANNMPAEIAQQLQMFLPMISAQVNPIFSRLGPEIYVTQTYTRPFSVDSQQNLIAIASKNDDALNGALAGMAPLIGLEGRDFQGNQIWSAGPGFGQGMIPMPEGGFSLGVGFGHMFVGPDSAVEGAMRQAAGGGNAFAENESFTNAMGALSNSGLSYSYTNLEETLAYQSWMFENMDQIIENQMQQMGGMGGMGMMPMDNPFEDLPDMGRVAEFLGDSVMEYQLVDGGIKGTFIVLRPAE